MSCFDQIHFSSSLKKKKKLNNGTDGLLEKCKMIYGLRNYGKRRVFFRLVFVWYDRNI